jgi:hypothetical protein
MSDHICSPRIRPLAHVLIVAAQLFGFAGYADVLPIPQPWPCTGRASCLPGRICDYPTAFGNP